jgi:NAD(P)-dependent dehydrogenase (short-subunit alcohol dehydrogenase family)
MDARPEPAQSRKDVPDLPNALNLRLVYCDLEDLFSVRNAASELRFQLSRIDILINNAGGIFQKRELGKNGIEKHLAVNHLGHFVLTSELIDLLKASGARIIHVSSEAHRIGKLDFDDLQMQKGYAAFKAYGNAKLMNIYFAKELHRRYHDQGIKSFALHPGVIKSGFYTHFTGLYRWMTPLLSPLMKTPEQGAETIVFLAEEDVDASSGNYFKNKKISRPSRLSEDQALAEQLWNKSAELAGAIMN